MVKNQIRRCFSKCRLFLFLILFAPISYAFYKTNEYCAEVYNPDAWWSVFKYTWVSNDVLIIRIIWYKLAVLIVLTLVLDFGLCKIICKKGDRV